MNKIAETVYVLFNSDGTPYVAPYHQDKNTVISTFGTRREAREEKRDAKFFEGINLKIAKAKANYTVQNYVR
jgi:hypothetical protein